jgi:serine acetyltransferase
MDKSALKKHLHECLRREVMMSNNPFSWGNVIHKAFKCPERRFNFWWRIASYFYNSDGKFNKQVAKRINRKLIQKYNTEIQLPAVIGPGLVVTHFVAVVINGCAIIGSNFKIRHNCTVGLGGSINENFTKPIIKIGDNVQIGVGSSILGNNLVIGNNVTIGAMSFINKNIPDNTVAYSEKKLNLKTRTVENIIQE